MSESVRRALFFSFLDRYAGLLITIGSSMVLARLLTPQQTGTFSVAMGLLAFAAVFRDLGAGQYLLQAKELTDARIRSVWAVQLGLGTALAVLIAIAAFPASLYFREPALRPIFWVLAASYVVNPFGSITYAWLMRQMRFQALALMRFSAGVTGGAVSIGLAWAGWGAISLAWGALAGILVQAVVATCYRPRHFPWLPGVQELGSVLQFGSRLTGSSLLGTARDALPELVIARAQDLSTAGYFSRANGLLSMVLRLVLDATVAVAQAMFAQRHRASEPIAPGFLTALGHVTALCWSLIAFVAVMAEEAIAVLYGSQWGVSVGLARWLAVGVAATAPVGICAAMLMVTGGTKLQLRLSLVHALLVVAGAMLAAPFGIVPTCQALAVANLLGALTWLRYSCRHAGLNVSALIQPLAKSLSLVVGVCAAALVAKLLAEGLAAALLILALGGGAALLAFLAGVRVVRHPLQAEVDRALTQVLAKWRSLRP